MTDPVLSEDYHGRYWTFSTHPLPRGTRSAWCSDLECLDFVTLEHEPGGWRWHHGHDHDDPGRRRRGPDRRRARPRAC